MESVTEILKEENERMQAKVQEIYEAWIKDKAEEIAYLKAQIARRPPLDPEKLPAPNPNPPPLVIPCGTEEEERDRNAEP